MTFRTVTGSYSRRCGEVAAAVVLAMLSGCSSDDAASASKKDCRSTDLACYSPFECRPDDISGDYRCLSPSGTTVACMSQPAGASVPLAQTPSGAVVHWVSGDCIGVSYAPELEAASNNLASAVAAWNAVSCMAVCLQPPVSSTTETAFARGERRIHFDANAPDGTPASATIFFENSTGKLLGVNVDVDPAQAGSLPISDFVKLLGAALGIAGTSAVEVVSDQPAQAVRDTLCLLYATPSACGD